MTDNTAVVTWLVIIGICSLTQTLLTLVLLGTAWRRWKQAEEAIEAFKRDHLAPAMEKIDHLSVEVQEVIGRVRRVDDQVRGVLTGASTAVSGLARHATHRAWPVLGVLNGLRAAASVLLRPKPATHQAASPQPASHPSRYATPQPPPSRQPVARPSTTRRDDRDDEARFVYEGGTQHAR